MELFLFLQFALLVCHLSLLFTYCKRVKNIMTSYIIELLILDNGERYPILVAEDGMPHFHVTLWVTSQLRPKGKAESTIINKLYHVKRLLAWLEIEKRNLFSEFQKGMFLNLNDIEQLRRVLSISIQHQKKETPSHRNKIIKFGKAYSIESNFSPSNGASHQYNCITSAMEYLVFLARLATQFNSTPESNREIKRMEKLLRSSRPKAKNQNSNFNRSLSVPSDLVRNFMAIAHYNHEQNPFKNEGIRFRNHLIFLLLEGVGIRRGELLSLKLEYIITYGPEKTIVVTRSHDDKNDTRRRQPVTKTRERQLAISPYIAEQIDIYISKYRSKFQQSRKHPYLFVSHKPGRTQGYPLSGSSFDNTIMPTMKSVDTCFSVIYPHFFRHDWNERFSESIDSNNMGCQNTEDYISPDKEAKMRKHQMGHASEESGKVYNQRHITRKANEVSLLEQKELQRKTETKNNDE